LGAEAHGFSDEDSLVILTNSPTEHSRTLTIAGGEIYA
jgi:hypothetical protein